MKLWIVIYVVGKIGATVGPIPYDESECWVRAAQSWSELDDKVVTEQGYTKDDVQFKCEWHAERPEHDPMFGPVQERR